MRKRWHRSLVLCTAGLVAALYWAFCAEPGRARSSARRPRAHQDDLFLEAQPYGTASQVDPRTVATLIRSLREAEEEARIHALRTVSLFGDVAVEVLRKGLASQEPAHRRAAVLALGEVEPPTGETVELLGRALEDDDRWVRFYACVGLGNAGPLAHESIPALVRLMDEDDLCWAACRSLGAIGPRAQLAVPQILKVLQEHGSGEIAAARALGQIQAESRMVTPALILSLDDWDWHLRLAACEALAELRPRSMAAMAALVRVLEDESAAVRAMAARALAAMGPAAAEALPHLIDLLRDPRTRWAAAGAIGEFGPSTKRLVPSLRRALRREGALPPEAAALVLGRMKVQHAVPDLIQALRHTKPDVRCAAAQALGWIRPTSEQAVSALSHAIEDPESGKAAVVALGETGCPARPVVEELAAALPRVYGRHRVAIVDTIRRMGAAAVAEATALLAAFVRDGASGRASPSPCVLGDRRIFSGGAFVGSGRGEYASDVISAAVWALGELRTVDSVGPLLAAMSDRMARHEAVVALGKLGPEGKAAIPALIGLFGEGEARRELANTLGRMGTAARSAAPNLLAAFEDAGNWTRISIAEALAAIGADSTPTVPFLLDLLDTYAPPPEDDRVESRVAASKDLREPAAAALRRIPGGAQTAVAHLADTYQSVRPLSRERLATALQESRVDLATARELLLRAVVDPVLKRDAIWALGCLGGGSREATLCLLSIADDPCESAANRLLAGQSLQRLNSGRPARHGPAVAR